MIPEGITLADILQLAAAPGAIVLIIVWWFREEIKVRIAGRAFDRQALVTDVAAMREELASHTRKEEERWEEFDDIIERIVRLETRHEDVMRELSKIDAQLAAQTSALLNIATKLGGA